MEGVTRATRIEAVDKICADAVDVARAAAVEEGGRQVGEHLGVQSDGARVVTHLFASLVPGYSGWRWAVTVARASRAKLVTVDEVVLLPGADAVLAPEWLPWSERLQPGDLGVGDLLLTEPDDDRLAPAYLQSDDPAVEEVALELGLGRVRVLSRSGRDESALRWRGGDRGPQTAMATHAPAPCATCGFYLPLAGSLRAAFGVCSNEFAPADGQVVAADFGCGAHSEALVEAVPRSAAPEPTLDDVGFDVEPRRSPAAGSVDTTEDDDLGHS